MQFLEDELKIARTYKLKNIVSRVGEPVKVETTKEYTQIGIRSHGKGIFIKDPVSGLELGNKRVFWVEPNCFIVNIVFAWERAVSRTTDALVGYIASHRFPMYKVDKELINLDYFTEYFQTKKGKSLLELASPGGAGRNKTLGQKEFLDLEVTVPNLEIQNYITSFIKLLDSKIQMQQKKVELLKQQKKGLMQKIFKQEIRFKDEDGGDYPSWEIKELNRVSEINPKSPNLNDEFYYIDLESVKNGVLMKVEVVSKKDAPSRAQRVVQKDDILYQTVRPYQKNNYYVLENKSTQTVASTGYAQIRVKKDINSIYLYQYLQTFEFTNLVLKSCTGTSYPAINSSDLGDLTIKIPSLKEQIKIAKCLSKLDEKIQLEQQKLDVLQKQKNGFMQQMFI